MKNNKKKCFKDKTKGPVSPWFQKRNIDIEFKRINRLMLEYRLA